MGWWNPLPLLDLCCVRIFRNDHTFSRKPVMCIMGWGDAGDLQIWYPPPPPPIFVGPRVTLRGTSGWMPPSCEAFGQLFSREFF